MDNLNIKDIIEKIKDVDMNEKQKDNVVSYLIELDGHLNVYNKMYSFVIENIGDENCIKYAKKELELRLMDLEAIASCYLESNCIKYEDGVIYKIINDSDVPF